MLEFVAFRLGQRKRNLESPLSGGCSHFQIAFAGIKTLLHPNVLTEKANLELSLVQVTVCVISQSTFY